MSSFTGYVTYLEYTAGSSKGGVERGDLFNGVYSMGQMTPARENYTGDRVVDTLKAGETEFVFVWKPVLPTVKAIDSKTGEDVDFELTEIDVPAPGKDPQTVKHIMKLILKEASENDVKIAYV